MAMSSLRLENLLLGPFATQMLVPSCLPLFSICLAWHTQFPPDRASVQFVVCLVVLSILGSGSNPPAATERTAT